MSPIRRIYVSHPIAGLSEEAKKELEERGKSFVRLLISDFARPAIAVLPRTIAPACGVERAAHTGPNQCTIPGRFIPGDVHSVQCYMRGDIAELLRCDGILMMTGWQQSAGCRDELNVAGMCGVPVFMYGDQ